MAVCTILDRPCECELSDVRYFYSWFHCLDATVITVAFVIDVCLKGVVEEVGSLVVVLRLWRVFKVRDLLAIVSVVNVIPSTTCRSSKNSALALKNRWSPCTRGLRISRNRMVISNTNLMR